MKRKEHGVVAVIKHDDWDGSGTTSPDIAIIKLAKKVKFTVNTGDIIKKNSIFPACLPNARIRSHLYNTKAYVVGNRYVHYLKCMNSAYITADGHPEVQCPRTDLNKKFLPRPKTTTA